MKNLKVKAIKISMTVMKTHYMVVMSKNKPVPVIEIRMNNIWIEVVRMTPFVDIRVEY